jgi:sialate O-acetylesterase
MSKQSKTYLRINGMVFLILTITAHAFANIRLPSVIGSNMVLQQNSSAKLWGWGEPGEKLFVTTSWNNRIDSLKVDENGKWLMNIPTPVAGGPYNITLRGYNTIVLQNVLIGEVWICSGQSNMEMSYNWGIPQMKADIATAANSNIRFYQVPRSTAVAPQEMGEGKWTECDSNTAKSFSAAAYYFGKKLNADLNVPIGLIQVAWGGTPAETWTPAERVENDPVLKQASAKLNRAPGWPITPGYTYNGMIAPVINTQIAGAIWYQGEANTGTASTYQQLLTTMIRSWREKSGKEFPFYIVQLAPYKYGNKNIAALLREAQQKTTALSKTGIVITTDLAEDTMNIHPKNKKDVGYRLANLALADTYGKNIPTAWTPAFESMTVNKNQVVVSIAHVPNGLSQKDKSITGFSIAGADKIFYPADAKIKGNTIIVSSKSVTQPVAVRYAFSNTAVGNVFSKEGLPLAPFRTDDWEVDTSPVK